MDVRSHSLNNKQAQLPSLSMAKYAKLGHIVRMSQMLRAWRKKATFRSDVPSGHVAMCVGSNCKRFVVRTAYLNHPIFRQLLSEAEEEYGFGYQSGPLAIPCDELVFEEILRFVSRSESGLTRSCRGSMIRNKNFGFLRRISTVTYVVSILVPNQ